MGNISEDVLVLPALRGELGDWVFYCALMPLDAVAERVQFAQFIHKSSGLNDVIQRALSARSQDITAYLLGHGDRFFNSLVIGVYGGEPQWLDVNIGRNPYIRVPRAVQEKLGLLVLSGNEQLFALDGQHRVKGIQGAVEKRPTLSNEQVSCIFVAHRTTRAGLERTRRLFTTLNRYAKAVSERDIVAQDEDDVAAIVTRRLVDEHGLFRADKTWTKEARNLRAGDRQSFTTLVALFRTVDSILGGLHQLKPAMWKAYRRKRPSDDQIEADYLACAKVWDRLARHLPAIREITEAPGKSLTAGRFRTRSGGHLLFRPIGLEIFGRALGRLLGKGAKPGMAVRALAKVPMDISAEPWREVLWSATRRLMITEHKKLAVELMFYGAGGELSERRLHRVREVLAGIHRVHQRRVRIRRYGMALR